MAHQSLVPNLVQVFIFRQEIRFQEDLWQWFDNDFRMSIAIHFIEKNEYLVFEKNKAFVGLRSCDNVKKGHSSNMWTGQGFKYRELVRPAGLSSRPFLLILLADPSSSFVLWLYAYCTMHIITCKVHMLHITHYILHDIFVSAGQKYVCIQIISPIWPHLASFGPVWPFWPCLAP